MEFLKDSLLGSRQKKPGISENALLGSRQGIVEVSGSFLLGSRQKNMGFPKSPFLVQDRNPPA